MNIDMVAAAKTALLSATIFAVFVVAYLYPPAGEVLLKIIFTAVAVITVYNIYRFFALSRDDRN
jgi:hypothetical protein